MPTKATRGRRCLSGLQLDGILHHHGGDEDSGKSLKRQHTVQDLARGMVLPTFRMVLWPLTLACDLDSDFRQGGKERMDVLTHGQYSKPGIRQEFSDPV